MKEKQPLGGVHHSLPNVQKLSVVGPALVFLLTGLSHQTSAQSSSSETPAWAPDSISQAQQMRIHKDIDQGSQPTPNVIPRLEFDKDPAGVIATFQPGGATFTANNAFFRDLGTNGRTCFTCHRPEDGWSISASGVKARFESSYGKDPLFRLIDGATCPTDPVTTLQDKRNAYTLLINKGLIRIALPLPPASSLQFKITGVDDPYHCTTLTSPTTGMVSVYRRPLPSTNLGFLSGIMWDGREPSLESQSVDATLIHAQAKAAPTKNEQAQIVAFEKGIFTAQIFDRRAHRLYADNATGGPVALPQQLARFYLGVNDPFGLNPKKVPFDPNIFNLYKAWEGIRHNDDNAELTSVALSAHQAA